MLCDAGYQTYLLGTWVREGQALTLEEGVRRLTSDPAEVFGVRGRGRLAPGLAADVAIFDATRAGPTAASGGSTCRAAPSAWSCHCATSSTPWSTAR